MQTYHYARLIGRNSGPNACTVQANTEAEAESLACQKLGPQHVRRYLPYPAK